MVYSVSSQFIDESEKKMLSPLRKFFIGPSDYSDRVVKWPVFKREAQTFKASNLKLSLSNHDGALNTFYQSTYKMVTSSYIQFGFDYGGSTELITTFTGAFNRIEYKKEQTVIHLKDKLFDVSNIVIGSTDSPVDISSVIPTELFWILCTCYGGLSTAESTNNPDIDYDAFLEWARIFSMDNVLVSAHYAGEKVSEALSRLAKMTDSTIYAEGDGKIYGARFSLVNTHNTVITEDNTIEITADVKKRNLINKQIVGYNYSVESKYWINQVSIVNSDSVNSFGLAEDYLQDNTIWYVNGLSGLNVANRRIGRYYEPPIYWNIKTPLIGIIRQMGENIRLVNSFYAQQSEDVKRIVGLKFDMHNVALTFQLDPSEQFEPFVLDVDSLDHPERFLI